MRHPWLPMLLLAVVALAVHGAAAAEAQGAASDSSAAAGTQQRSSAEAQPRADSAQAAAAAGGGNANAEAATASADRSGAGSSGSRAGTAKKLPMQDCSTDESGLPLASLNVEAAWESHGLREGNDITIVTQMSPRRARAMTELCSQWGGVVSVATYVPLLNGTLVAEEGTPADWAVPDVIRHLSAFHKQMETEGPCKLDMVLYSEEVDSATMAAFYPVNALRNRALAQAKTELVMLDDVDFIVSGSLSDPEHYPAILRLCRAGKAVVLPALEPADALGIREGTKVALRALQEGKQRAAAQYKKKRLKPFHIERWDLAHRATDYDKWTTAKDFYDIEYEHDFEPYIVAQREKLPVYDERLRGYFENKAVHIRHLATLGMKFVVHPTEFVVHLPHKESAARLMIIDPSNAALRDKVQGLGHRMREWIDARAYTPVTTDTCTPEEQQAAAQRHRKRAANEAAAAGSTQADQQGVQPDARAAAGVGASGAANVGSAAQKQVGSAESEGAKSQLSQQARRQDASSSGQQQNTVAAEGETVAVRSSRASSGGAETKADSIEDSGDAGEVRLPWRGAGSVPQQTSDATESAQLKTTADSASAKLTDANSIGHAADTNSGSIDLQSRPGNGAGAAAIQQ